MKNKYQVVRFAHLTRAQRYARGFKKKYGYTPSIFKERSRSARKDWYVIIKPSRLKKIWSKPK